MIRRRVAGTTILEALLSIVMVVVLTLSATTLFGYFATRMSADTTQTAVALQADSLADELTQFISQAKTCDLPTVGRITALRCTMPANGIDTNQDGVLDTFAPSGYDAAKDTEIFNTGNYVWFYMSDDTGAWGADGTTFWRASPPSAATPSQPDRNTNWALYYGGERKWNYIDGVSFVIDAPHETVTFTINASSYYRAERTSASEASNSDNTKVTVTRTVFWGSYR